MERLAELWPVTWFSFVLLGLFQILIYKGKLAFKAHRLAANDVSTSLQIGWIVIAGLTCTSVAYGYLELIQHQRLDGMLIPQYRLGRVLISIAIVASWAPGWRLCNRSRHYWPILIALYVIWCGLWTLWAASF